MHWLLLVLAGTCESIWPACMKKAWQVGGWFFPTASILGIILAMGLMFFVQKTVPVTVAYPVFVGIAMTGTFLLGALWLGETVTLLRLGFVGLIVVGILGLAWTA